MDDTLADPRYIASHPGIRSEVAVPLIVQDRVIGVMDLESERIGYFRDEHLHLLTLLVARRSRSRSKTPGCTKNSRSASSAWSRT